MIDQEKFGRIKSEGHKLGGELKQQSLTHIIGALGLVAGLAWNEAIKGMIDQVVSQGQDTLIARFLYALIVTVVVVILSVYLLRLFKKDEENKEE